MKLILAAALCLPLCARAEPLARDRAPASARNASAGWVATDGRSREARVPDARPKPSLPPGPGASEWPGGWPTSHGVSAPPRAPALGPAWPRTATEARVLLAFLPEEDEAAKARIAEALVVLDARHGRIFEEARWQGLIASEPWYVPSPEWSVARLSEGEREASELLGTALRHRGGALPR